ncbi:hypothetical protein [Nocardia terpenica]|uniref:hypothetical protein n=1 Tax=Nocardia terpenica TaxID=455432 RepID=UPI0012E9566A|nr:hypothetical protein [Nocardia terpenica]NQE89062.1 hypothetical protein [Nocardia terpenica]
MKRHAESFWGPCSVCGGSQLLDVETDHLCNICIGGLTQYDSQEEAFEADRRETEARNRVRRLSLVRNPEYVVTEPSRWRPASDSGTRGVAPLTVRTPSGQVCYGGH